MIEESHILCINQPCDDTGRNVKRSRQRCVQVGMRLTFPSLLLRTVNAVKESIMLFSIFSAVHFTSLLTFFSAESDGKAILLAWDTISLWLHGIAMVEAKSSDVVGSNLSFLLGFVVSSTWTVTSNSLWPDFSGTDTLWRWSSAMREGSILSLLLSSIAIYPDWATIRRPLSGSRPLSGLC